MQTPWEIFSNLSGVICLPQGQCFSNKLSCFSFEKCFPNWKKKKKKKVLDYTMSQRVQLLWKNEVLNLKFIFLNFFNIFSSWAWIFGIFQQSSLLEHLDIWDCGCFLNSSIWEQIQSTKGYHLRSFKRLSFRRIRFWSSPGCSICCKAVVCYKA